MDSERASSAGYNEEDAYFHRKDQELLARRRAELDAARAKGATAGSLQCPRCKSAMTEVAVEHVRVDQCTGCGGVFLDKGELELLTHGKSGGFFKRMFGK